jgi:signal transduction histidine kinase
VVALSHNSEIVLLRAAQEALTNVGRHAQAGSATLVLAFGEGTASVAVADDGAGFDPAQPPGFGLSQLRSRAAEVGGRAEVTSGPGEGTTVRVTVPVTVK